MTAEGQVTGAARAVRPWHVAMAGYLVALTVFVVREGMPLDRGMQAALILAGVLAWQVGRPLRRWGRTLADWLPFFAALVIYDHTRGVADTLGRPVLVEGLVEAETAVFGGVLPTIVLQDLFYDPVTVQWYDVVAAVVYFSHFFVAWTIAAVLYLRSRDSWLFYTKLVLTLTYLGLLTYVLLPAAPPWYAAHHGLVEPVERAATRGWWEIGMQSAGRLVEQGQADVNLVAALPSLHAGTSMLVVLWAWSRVRSAWGRAVLAAYGLGMGLTLVYGGEHYVLDVLMGWAYAGAVVAAWTWWENRRRELPVRPSSAVPAAEPVGVRGWAGGDPEAARRPAG
ncbi:MAG: phosphatase PAP2 family protein [Actinomycetes bacterium]